MGDLPWENVSALAGAVSTLLAAGSLTVAFLQYRRGHRPPATSGPGVEQGNRAGDNSTQYISHTVNHHWGGAGWLVALVLGLLGFGVFAIDLLTPPPATPTVEVPAVTPAQPPLPPGEFTALEAGDATPQQTKQVGPQAVVREPPASSERLRPAQHTGAKQLEAKGARSAGQSAPSEPSALSEPSRTAVGVPPVPAPAEPSTPAPAPPARTWPDPRPEPESPNVPRPPKANLTSLIPSEHELKARSVIPDKLRRLGKGIIPSEEELHGGARTAETAPGSQAL